METSIVWQIFFIILWLECKVEDNHTDTAVKRKSISLVIGIEGDVERWADMK